MGEGGPLAVDEETPTRRQYITISTFLYPRPLSPDFLIYLCALIKSYRLRPYLYISAFLYRAYQVRYRDVCQRPYDPQADVAVRQLQLRPAYYLYKNLLYNLQLFLAFLPLRGFFQEMIPKTFLFSGHILTQFSRETFQILVFPYLHIFTELCLYKCAFSSQDSSSTASGPPSPRRRLSTSSCAAATAAAPSEASASGAASAKATAMISRAVVISARISWSAKEYEREETTAATTLH